MLGRLKNKMILAIYINVLANIHVILLAIFSDSKYSTLSDVNLTLLKTFEKNILKSFPKK